jgi:Nucleotidyl transferase AbiEii toxin, Type IV TA system
MIMAFLNPTPPERMVDASGRPYFLWDVDMTLDQFRTGLHDADPDAKAYLIGKLMRQAKPDDVFTFVRLAEIMEGWPRLERLLGQSAPMWRWLLERWRKDRHGRERVIGGARILAESPHEVLVSKLFAVLSRSELRDLEDVRALLDDGGDLARAMSDAPRKDAGFSPITFAWVLEQLQIAAMGCALRRGDDEVRGLEEFRGRLVADALTLAKPA